ncbi:hypothetical protein, partial [Treponema endosymbiont of Eucomonympha sp.]|uniref:hypothetical protein n=1 Tax=Treponema endosymbiont of Eucomonympha sp. TaxID=1580831 RepID=UPI001396AE61
MKRNEGIHRHDISDEAWGPGNERRFPRGGRRISEKPRANERLATCGKRLYAASLLRKLGSNAYERCGSPFRELGRFPARGTLGAHQATPITRTKRLASCAPNASPHAQQTYV